MADAVLCRPRICWPPVDSSQTTLNLGQMYLYLHRDFSQMLMTAWPPVSCRGHWLPRSAWSVLAMAACMRVWRAEEEALPPGGCAVVFCNRPHLLGMLAEPECFACRAGQACTREQQSRLAGASHWYTGACQVLDDIMWPGIGKRPRTMSA